MPCSMYEGVTAADFAASDARAALARANEAMKVANEVTDILCRVLRTLTPETIQSFGPDVVQWVERHKAHDAEHGRPWP